MKMKSLQIISNVMLSSVAGIRGKTLFF